MTFVQAHCTLKTQAEQFVDNHKLLLQFFIICAIISSTLIFSRIYRNSCGEIDFKSTIVFFQTLSQSDAFLIISRPVG